MSQHGCTRFLLPVLWSVFLSVVIGASQEILAQPPPSISLTSQDHPGDEMAFPIKLVCSLKSHIKLPFHGVIRTVPAQTGRPIKAGEPLASYRLTPEATVNLRQRMFSHEVRELEVRLAEVERAAVELKGVRNKLEASPKRDASTSQSLAQVDEQIHALERQQEAIRNRLWLERVFVQDNLTLLSKLLGKTITPGQPLDEALLAAPMDGHILWLHPDLREGMELQANMVVSQVGVMHPMLGRGEVFENEAMKIEVGMKGLVELESLPGHTFEAWVSRISMVPVDSRPTQPSYYDVELTVPNPDLLLREGLAGLVRLRR